jgi:hypothetical protein
LRRREEHPYSLSGCRDPEIQALPPPRVPLVFQGCAWRYRSPSAVRHSTAVRPAWEWQVRPVSNTWMPGAPDIPRAHLSSPGAPVIFMGAPGVIEVHLQSTGAPWEWPPPAGGAPSALFQISGCQVHLGISRCAWHLQVHLASPGAPDAYGIRRGSAARGSSAAADHGPEVRLGHAQHRVSECGGVWVGVGCP